METMTDFVLFGSKITADSDFSHKIKRHLLLGRKVMTNLDSIWKSRHICSFIPIQTRSFLAFFISHVCVCVCVLVFQSRPILCDPMDCSPPDSSVHGILQARIPECIDISFSRGSSWPMGSNPGRFFTVWAPREAHLYIWHISYIIWLFFAIYSH